MGPVDVIGQASGEKSQALSRGSIMGQLHVTQVTVDVQPLCHFM
jgi:hypothetical protein